MAVLIDPAGGVVDRRGSAGDYEEPSAKVGHQITPAVLIKLQPLQNRLDRVGDPVRLPLRQLPAGPIQQLQIITQRHRQKTLAAAPSAGLVDWAF